uniref:Uncharacterized protein n=1 Tax=Meloidogyne enterolobii TaxID=390850 RepID=A0A6V7UB74_MELEN|nr:unnamed protein product [Meloidogyne enterolobii]
MLRICGFLVLLQIATKVSLTPSLKLNLKNSSGASPTTAGSSHFGSLKFFHLTKNFIGLPSSSLRTSIISSKAQNEENLLHLHFFLQIFYVF